MPAVTGKVAEAEPCEIVTVEGTLAALEFELDRATAMPPLPAAAVRLTVPVPDWPLVIEAGLTETLLRVGGGGLIVIPNVALEPE